MGWGQESDRHTVHMHKAFPVHSTHTTQAEEPERLHQQLGESLANHFNFLPRWSCCHLRPTPHMYTAGSCSPHAPARLLKP